ncbi:MAG: endonuclease VII domain-containing protein [Actinomycetota bacterium]|nr:endonuclease VII domain-containing protein [Actinomycetota bacterium]
MIDVSAVLWMLERIAAGDVDARTVQDWLRQATLWDSGCCGECDRAAPYYEEARSRYDAAARRWEREQEQLDPAVYPYILNKGKIHRLGCRYPPKPALAPFPTDLHTFAGLFDGCGEDLDAVFEELDHRFSRSAQRIGVGEVLNMIVRSGVGAVEAKLCRTCRPLLPDLDPSATTLRPACWAWPADSAVRDRLRIAATQSPRTDDANILPEQRVEFAMLEQWHGGRCAICGELPILGGLVRDHDHGSGMVRGLLCYSCNTAEGRSTSLLFANYRQRPPAVILAIEVLYLPPGFRPGVGHMPVAAKARL